MFQVGDMVGMAWPAIGLTEQDSWSYGVVTSVLSDGIHVLWFHRDVDTWYRLSYALKHFKRVEDNGKR